jgi:hypothetical protein
MRALLLECWRVALVVAIAVLTPIAIAVRVGCVCALGFWGCCLPAVGFSIPRLGLLLYSIGTWIGAGITLPILLLAAIALIGVRAALGLGFEVVVEDYRRQSKAVQFVVVLARRDPGSARPFAWDARALSKPNSGKRAAQTQPQIVSAPSSGRADEFGALYSAYRQRHCGVSGAG